MTTEHTARQIEQEAAAIARVMRRVGPIADEHDRGLITSTAAQFLRLGWTEDDTVAFLRCMEEVNPELSEDVALRRMVAIRSKYEERHER